MPVAVPGVRVGDVLLGTRNLRRWLRAAAILAHLGKSNYPGFRGVDPARIYSPNKQDEFVVAANSCRVLAVWEGREQIVLPFVNPSPAPEWATNPTRIDPTIFSQWFVRTGKRSLDLREWPHFANGLKDCFAAGGHAASGFGSKESDSALGVTFSWNYALPLRGACGGSGVFFPPSYVSSVQSLRRVWKEGVLTHHLRYGVGPTLSEIEKFEELAVRRAAHLMRYAERRGMLAEVEDGLRKLRLHPEQNPASTAGIEAAASQKEYKKIATSKKPILEEMIKLWGAKAPGVEFFKKYSKPQE